jgi:alanine dehydrogenase
MAILAAFYCVWRSLGRLICTIHRKARRILGAKQPVTGKGENMRIGVPKEIKVHEYRVGLVPAAVRELVESGHEVLVQTGAAAGIGFADADYQRVGARIAATAEEVFAQSEMIVKVKEPQPQECAMLRKGQILYTYLHLAPDPRQTEALIKSGATCIAYETVTAPDGSLPLLTPMSEVAGRMSVQVGAYCLQKANGGRGILLGGVPGVAPAKVVVLGGGVAGTNAARWPWACGPTSPWWTARSSACANSRRSSGRRCAPNTPPRSTSTRWSTMPTS